MQSEARGLFAGVCRERERERGKEREVEKDAAGDGERTRARSRSDSGASAGSHSLMCVATEPVGGREPVPNLKPPYVVNLEWLWMPSMEAWS